MLAIHLAVNWKADTIILLGVDGGAGHFFGDHPVTLKTGGPVQWQMHAKQHERTAAMCQQKGIRVYNCTPNSLIDAYPKVELESVL